MASQLGRQLINNFIEIHEFAFMYPEILYVYVMIHKKLITQVYYRQETWMEAGMNTHTHTHTHFLSCGILNHAAIPFLQKLIMKTNKLSTQDIMKIRKGIGTMESKYIKDKIIT